MYAKAALFDDHMRPNSCEELRLVTTSPGALQRDEDVEPRLPICTGVSPFSSRRSAGQSRKGPNSVHLAGVRIEAERTAFTSLCAVQPPGHLSPCYVI